MNHCQLLELTPFLGFVKGDAVGIFKAGHGLYNRFFTIIDVPDPQTFKFRISPDPGIDSTNPDFAPGYFGRLWQGKRLVAEGNVCELMSLRDSDTGHAAVNLGGGAHSNPYLHLQLLARDNVVRMVDAARYGQINNGLAQGVVAGNCDRAIVEDNVIEPGYSIAGHTATVGFVLTGEQQANYNLTPQGATIPGYDHTANRPVDTTETFIEEALALAML